MKHRLIAGMVLLLLLLAIVPIVGRIASDSTSSIPILATYQCGLAFRPFDIAFAPDGRLFSSDGPGNALYEHAPGCRQIVGIGTIPGNRFQLVGVTVDGGNRLCFTALRNDPRDIMLPIPPTGAMANSPSIWCWTTTPAMHLHPEIEAARLRGHYAFGMASYRGRYYLASWYGHGLITVTGRGRTIQEINLEPWFPLFIHPVSHNEMLVTALSAVAPASDPYQVIHHAGGGVILHVRNGIATVIADDLEYPTGIVAVEDLLYVADYLTGEVHVYTRSGDRLVSRGGFHGPMGMARAPNDDICVAEMDAGRITCKPLEWFHSAQ